MRFNFLFMSIMAMLGIVPLASAAGGDTFQVGSFTFGIISEDLATVVVESYNSDEVTELSIPSVVEYDSKSYTVVRLGAASFASNSLEHVIIPSTVLAVDNAPFRNCGVLREISLDNNSCFTVVNGVLYDSSVSRLIECPRNTVHAVLRVPATVRSIDSWACWYCQRITDVVMPESVVEIGSSAFDWCTSLRSVVLPSALESLPSQCFRNCVSLEQITVPSTVSQIGMSCFGKSGLKVINVSNPIPSKLVSRVFDGLLPDLVVNIPAGTMGAYKATSGWSDVTNFMESINLESGTLFGDNKFRYKLLSSSDRTVSVIGMKKPDQAMDINIDGILAGAYTVTKIADGALRDVHLRSAGLPESLTCIGVESFAGTWLQSIDIPAGVTDIGTDAFADDKYLMNFNVSPDNTVYCDIEGVLFDKDMKILIQHPAFSSTEISYVVPESVGQVASPGFSGCTSLVSVTLPAGVSKIAKSAFAGCTSLGEIYSFAPAPPVAEAGTFDGVPAEIPVYVPDDALNLYAAAAGWDYFSAFREIGSVKIVFGKENILLTEGDSAGLDVSVTAGGTVSVSSETWTSSDPAVATVDADGTVAALSVGECEITLSVTDNYGRVFTNSCRVVVSERSGIRSIYTIADGSVITGVYSLQGIRLGSTLEDVPAGIYVVKCDDGRGRIFVK